jgi:lipopolysaccharide transport system ATP-binding protein
MFSDAVISLSSVSKSFPVYEKPHHRLLQMLTPRSKKNLWHKKFAALTDISLTIGRGETVGIVGRNGSGKSTLLQVICGTLTPNAGVVKVHGRVAALLELGAGFNPDFTGRENVFLNGTLLGLTKAEVANRFDEIAKFADIGDFIDQPVKSYSSGMYVRLAFAVAINVTPDVLIIDEALSVGDEAFQRKCFSRINAIREQGATVLFVSHTASTVTELCNRAILLDRGELLGVGSPKFIISRYQKMLYSPPDKLEELRQLIKHEASSEDDQAISPSLNPDELNSSKPGNEGSESKQTKILAQFEPNMAPQSTVSYPMRGACISCVEILDADGRKVNILVAGEEYVYRYRVDFSVAASGVRFGMLIKSVSGVEIGGAVTAHQPDALYYVDGGSSLQVAFTFRCLLATGTYFVNAGVVGRVGEVEEYLHRLVDIGMFRVMPDPRRTVVGIVDFEIASRIDSLGAQSGDIGKIMSQDLGNGVLSHAH